MVMIWVLFILMLFVDDENEVDYGDYGDYHHLSDCSGPVEGRVPQTSLVEGAISVALLPG